MINKTPNWSFRTIDKKMQTFFHMCEREREKQVVLGATSGMACGDRKSLKLGDRLTSILAKPQGGAEPPSSVSWAHGRSRHALAHASAPASAPVTVSLGAGIRDGCLCSATSPLGWRGAQCRAGLSRPMCIL